jgi:hypothetical protein
VGGFGRAGRGCGRAEGFFPQAKRGGLDARARAREGCNGWGAGGNSPARRGCDLVGRRGGGAGAQKDFFHRLNGGGLDARARARNGCSGRESVRV